MNHDRLAKFARRLSALLIGAAVLLPLLTIFAWAMPETVVGLEGDRLPRDWASALALVQNLLLACGLIALAIPLRRVGEARAFGPGLARGFRYFAAFLLATALARIVLPALADLLLAMTAGQRRLTLSIADRDIIDLLVALVLFLVARLFVEAARLDEDSRSIV